MKSYAKRCRKHVDFILPALILFSITAEPESITGGVHTDGIVLCALFFFSVLGG